MRNVPSRVMPVTTTFSGCTVRVYQKRLTQSPRFASATISSRDASPGAMNMCSGIGPMVSPAGSACPVERASPPCLPAK